MKQREFFLRNATGFWLCRLKIRFTLGSTCCKISWLQHLKMLKTIHRYLKLFVPIEAFQGCGVWSKRFVPLSRSIHILVPYSWTLNSTFAFGLQTETKRLWMAGLMSLSVIFSAEQWWGALWLDLLGSAKWSMRDWSLWKILFKNAWHVGHNLGFEETTNFLQSSFANDLCLHTLQNHT